jgi:hypothetical protein
MDPQVDGSTSKNLARSEGLQVTSIQGQEEDQ